MLFLNTLKGFTTQYFPSLDQFCQSLLLVESCGLWLHVSCHQNPIWSIISVLPLFLINHGTLQPGSETLLSLPSLTAKRPRPASSLLHRPPPSRPSRPLQAAPNPTVTSRQEADSPQIGRGTWFGQVLRTGNGAKQYFSEFA